MSQLKHPLYNGPTIGSLKALSVVLGVPNVRELEAVARNAQSYYRPGPVVQKNGKNRPTIKAVGQLRTLQGRIKGRILTKVRFPEFLQGGVKDFFSPRDYIRNARRHANKRILIKQDVRNFFPSLSERQVCKIWQHFFGFHPDVALCLTHLTTRNNQLPQGAVTSNYLANLVFFDLEPELVSQLEAQSVHYTRYIDDISLSSDEFISDDQKSQIISQVVGMMLKWGLGPKRSKQQILDGSGRMSVHGLNINRREPTMSKDVRSAIRNRVHKLEQASDRITPEYEKEFVSLQGAVSTMKQLHRLEAEALQQRLSLIRPMPSDAKIARLRKQVSYCKKTRLPDRQGRGFSRRLNQVASAVGMIKHARPNEARKLLAQLAMVRETIR